MYNLQITAPFHSLTTIPWILLGMPANSDRNSPPRLPSNLVCQPGATTETTMTQTCGISIHFYAIGEGKNICDSHFAKCETNLRAFSRHTPIAGDSANESFESWLKQLGTTIQGTAVVGLSGGAVEDFKHRFRDQFKSGGWGIKQYSHLSTPFLKKPKKGVVEKIKKNGGVTSKTIKDTFTVGQTYELTAAPVPVPVLPTAPPPPPPPVGVPPVPVEIVQIEVVDGIVDVNDNNNNNNGNGNGNVNVNNNPPFVATNGIVKFKVFAGRTAGSQYVLDVISSGHGFDKDTLLQYHDGNNFKTLFKVASIMTDNSNICHYGCMVGSRNTPPIAVSGQVANSSPYVVLPLSKPTPRVVVDSTRANVLNIERDGLRDALRYLFHRKMNIQWSHHKSCPPPTYCLINRMNHIIANEEYLAALFINDIVRTDLVSMINSPVFNSISDGSPSSRSGFKSICQGVGTRFNFLVALLKDPSLIMNDNQKALKGGVDGRLNAGQRVKYEEAMADSAWVETVLKPHIAALWVNVE